MGDSKVLLWFRRDLRLRDNPALVAATAEGAVLPLYIDDSGKGSDTPGAASRWWLHHSLQALDASLGGALNCLAGDPLELIPQLCAREKIRTVMWNRCYEPAQIRRDSALKKRLQEMGVEVQSHNGSLLWEPWTVLKSDGTPYKVFTPYYRNGCLKNAEPRFPVPVPKRLTWAAPLKDRVSVDDLALLPTVQWYGGLEERWQAGEQGAAHRLSEFIRSRLPRYQNARNVPAEEGTSYLSPHLHFGEVSPHQVWYACQQQGADDKNRETFLTELGWREFSYYLLYHFPKLPEKNFNPAFDRFPWRRNQRALRAWQQGKTGIPIVDAGMRELWQTGTMHNRVRMIVASFLVKNLLIDWRSGAEWFMDCLVDADLANNSASWQWVAGSGADAAPYFRIFNPVLQGEKFDAKGNYVRQYCPELSRLPDRYIHCPWKTSEAVLQAAGLRLGKDYPEPIADLAQSRQEALEAFRNRGQTTKEIGDRPRFFENKETQNRGLSPISIIIRP